MKHGLKVFSFGAALVCAAAILATFSGCGKDDQARIRLLNASPGASALDLIVDDTAAVGGVSYAAASDYQDATPGTRHIEVEPSGSDTTMVDLRTSLAAQARYTLVVANYASIAEPILLTDATTKPGSGKFRLRVLQASPSLGAADIYVVTPGTDPGSVSPNVSNLAFESASDYFTLTAGTYEIDVNFAGTAVGALHLSSGAFGEGTQRTLVVLNAEAGGFTAIMLSDSN